MTRRRMAAVAALALGLATLGLALAQALQAFPRGALGIALLALALVLAWEGLIRRGRLRFLLLGSAAVLAAAVVVLLVASGPALVLAAVAAMALGLGAAHRAFRIHVALPPAPRPSRPVLFYNPRSGGGKATRFRLPDEARARGIEPIELTPGADLEQLVRRAIDDGADALAMAGGDGSQAIVARIAVEQGLPYSCIPAGTRNHFALDLGVDREDVTGALDAFVDGGERLVDLGEVNGLTFVNNVSLGPYAEAVQRDGYRDAKLRTLLDTVPDVLGPGEGLDLRWEGTDGDECGGGAAILVSNNRYRLGRAVGSGTRPRLDEGVLGVAVVEAPDGRLRDRAAARPWRSWTTPQFDVEARAPVPAGIDGEARVLDPPLHFRIRSGALRCRIARHHPGASPSAFEPDGAWDGIRALAGIAAGHDPRPVPGGAAPSGAPDG